MRLQFIISGATLGPKNARGTGGCREKWEGSGMAEMWGWHALSNVNGKVELSLTVWKPGRRVTGPVFCFQIDRPWVFQNCVGAGPKDFSLTF